METIFKNPKLKAQGGRNAFDRSQHRVFHSPFGAVLPFFCKRVIPDDYVELSVDSQFVCDDILRPAFIRLKEHFNFYFVPFNMLWMPFDNFITGQDNYFSKVAEDIQDGSLPQSVPVFGHKFLAKLFDTIQSEVDVHGFTKITGALRLLDLLGYGNYNALINAAGGTSLAYDELEGLFSGLEPMNLFALLAYQKVYYDYYRNPKYEENKTSAFNMDDVIGTQVLDETSSQDRWKGVFNMHYAWAKKDYFTDVSPNILPKSSDIGYHGLNGSAPYGAQNIQGVFGIPGASRGPIIASNNNLSSEQALNINTGDRVTLSGGTSASTTNTYTGSQTNVAALRFAFAYDKLLRRMREAGGTFDAQMLAQFGIVPYDQRHGKCIFIGGQTNRLHASDVVNTTGENLGFIGGNINCFSPSRQTFKYHCKDHGIIIGIYNTSLDFDYPSYAVERENICRYRFDWFNEAFQNLGLQPTFRMELLNINSSVVQGEIDWDPSEVEHTQAQRDILGYSIRYQEYKTSVDRVFGLYNFGSGDTDRQAWVTQFLPFQNGYNNGKRVAPLTMENLTFNPLMFNQVLKTNYNGDMMTDPFENNIYVKMKCISNMSSLGEVF